MQVWVGTMNFGKRTPAPEAARIVARALERGVTRFDTANVYGDGVAERLLAEALRGVPRDRYVLATKAGLGRVDKVEEGLSRRAIVAAAHASLARLGVSCVDLFLLHKPDPATPVGDTLDGVAQLLAEGSITSWGISNFAAWQTLELLHAAAGRGLSPPVSAQLLYNVVHREVEVEYVPFARAYGVEIVAYNPLAGGLLSGSYTGGASTGQRLKKNPMYNARYGSEVLRARADGYAALAAAHGRSLLELSYGFLASRVAAGALCGVAIGPATVAHLDAALTALASPLSDELRHAVDAAHTRELGTDTHYTR